VSHRTPYVSSSHTFSLPWSSPASKNQWGSFFFGGSPGFVLTGIKLRSCTRQVDSPSNSTSSSWDPAFRRYLSPSSDFYVCNRQTLPVPKRSCLPHSKLNKIKDIAVRRQLDCLRLAAKPEYIVRILDITVIVRPMKALLNVRVVFCWRSSSMQAKTCL
jgi:hypothetical protein